MQLPTELWILIALIVVGANLALTHLVALWQVLRVRELDLRWRLLALVPPALPVVSWMAKKRVLTIVWAAQLVAYVTLRIVA